MVIFTILYFLCGIIYVIIGIVTFLNDSKNKLNKIFFVLCMNLAFWAFMFTLKNRSIDAKTASLFHIYSTFSWSTVHCLLLHFIIVLTGKEDFFKKRFIIFDFLFSSFIFNLFVFFSTSNSTKFCKNKFRMGYPCSNG